MFQFLKNILGKPAQDQAGANSISRSPAPRPPAALPKPPAASRTRPATMPHRPPISGPARHSGSALVQIPLQAVLTGLPLELKGRVVQNEVGAASISVPLEKIVSQLSSGTVKMPFGELRGFAPQVFSTENDHDSISVPLPLNEILSRLNPALLVRRPSQKTVKAPEDTCRPFGERGSGMVFTGDAPKSEAPAAPPRAVTPASSANSDARSDPGTTETDFVYPGSSAGVPSDVPGPSGAVLVREYAYSVPTQFQVRAGSGSAPPGIGNTAAGSGDFQIRASGSTADAPSSRGSGAGASVFRKRAGSRRHADRFSGSSRGAVAGLFAPAIGRIESDRILRGHAGDARG